MSLNFIFISDPTSSIPESKCREILFEVITSSNIYKRFDSSHPFWEMFGARKEHKKKKVSYYEIENTDNPCILTLAVKPKEYLELFEDKKINKTQGYKKKICRTWF